jgi:hypothetical protein
MNASITKLVKPSISTHQNQDLHCIKPDYIDPNINIKLYDYIKLQARFFCRVLHHRHKNRQGLHPHGLPLLLTKTCRHRRSAAAAAYVKTRRRHRTAAAAA